MKRLNKLQSDRENHKETQNEESSIENESEEQKRIKEISEKIQKRLQMIRKLEQQKEKESQTAFKSTSEDPNSKETQLSSKEAKRLRRHHGENNNKSNQATSKSAENLKKASHFKEIQREEDHLRTKLTSKLQSSKKVQGISESSSRSRHSEKQQLSSAQSLRSKKKSGPKHVGELLSNPQKLLKKRKQANAKRYDLKELLKDDSSIEEISSPVPMNPFKKPPSQSSSNNGHSSSTPSDNKQSSAKAKSPKELRSKAKKEKGKSVKESQKASTTSGIDENKMDQENEANPPEIQDDLEGRLSQSMFYFENPSLSPKNPFLDQMNSELEPETHQSEVEKAQLTPNQENSQAEAKEPSEEDDLDADPLDLL